MKNGSREARKSAKGSFGGSKKAKRTIHFTEKLVTGDTVKVLHRKKTVGRDYKGAANAKLVKKLHRRAPLF